MNVVLCFMLVLLSLPTLSLCQTDTGTPVPKEHGLYYQSSNGLVPIEGQVISFARTGSRLSSAATFGIKSGKTNVQILGEKSAHTTVSMPVFYSGPPPARRGRRWICR